MKQKMNEWSSERGTDPLVCVFAWCGWSVPQKRSQSTERRKRWMPLITDICTTIRSVESWCPASKPAGVLVDLDLVGLIWPSLVEVCGGYSDWWWWPIVLSRLNVWGLVTRDLYSWLILTDLPAPSQTSHQNRDKNEKATKISTSSIWDDKKKQHWDQSFSPMRWCCACGSKRTGWQFSGGRRRKSYTTFKKGEEKHGGPRQFSQPVWVIEIFKHRMKLWMRMDNRMDPWHMCYNQQQNNTFGAITTNFVSLCVY